MATFIGIEYTTWWFLVVGAVFSGYAILDGFDLGAGAWHLFFKDDKSRRTALNAIGPVWDGNEVWLVIGGGALFAGFPIVYATLLSAMYIPFYALFGVDYFQGHFHRVSKQRAHEMVAKHVGWCLQFFQHHAGRASGCGIGQCASGNANRSRSGI